MDKSAIGMVNEPDAAEIKAHIDSNARNKSWFSSVALVMGTLLFYAVTFYCCALPSLLVRAFAVPLNGLAIGMLFIIGHDASHGCFTPDRKFDRFLARLVFLPSLWPNVAWKVLHNYFHHGFTCLKGKDYAWQPLSLDAYHRLPGWRQWLERHYKSFIGMAHNWIIAVWIRHAVWPPSSSRQMIRKRWREARFDYAVVLMFLVFELVLAVVLTWRLSGESLAFVHFLYGVVFCIGLPFWFFAIQAGLAILVQHTHPDTIWFKDKQEWSFFAAHVQSTVHFKYPFPLNKIYLDVMEHNAHHVDPTIPIYNLVEQQRRLEIAFPDDIIVENLSIKTMRRIFATCQLYDFDRHCWLAFDGTPTTLPIDLWHRRQKRGNS